MATDHAESNGFHERFGLTSNIDREADGRPMLQADEELFGTFASVSLLLGGASQGDGTLYVSTRRVIWTEAAAAPSAGRAFCVPYPSIAMHAMSSALDPDQPAAQQRPCIYMQLDAGGGPDVMRDGGDDNDGDEDDAAVPELHLIPADPSTLEAIFAALCECASKNPDPDQEDDEGEFFFDEDEVMAGAGAEARAARLQHLDGLLEMPRPEEFDQMVGEDEGRFEDADEEAEDDVEGQPEGQEQRRR